MQGSFPRSFARLPGRGTEETTLSAVRYAGGGSTKYAGVLGIQDGARFYVHFPTPVDWELLTNKKGTPDFVNDLRESGPQGQQGRESLVSDFLREYPALKAARQAKRGAASKKQEALTLRKKLESYVGEQTVTLLAGNESLSIPIKISKDKTGKVKIVASR